jgi:hypothetical protein
MQRASSGFRITRRRFSFWVGLGIFSIGEKLRASGFDEMAAAIMPSTDPAILPPSTPEHWRLAANQTWWWYERETLIGGQWTLTGITTPISKATGQPYSGRRGYLDESLVPVDLRRGDQIDDTEGAAESSDQPDPPRPDPTRRARHGRPPSKWLRSLDAEEIRIWLRTVEVPDAEVSGMTYWTHLTRDHSFDPEKITGLTVDEQAKLHAAAHYGY